jgi:uncharacterized membrane protein
LRRGRNIPNFFLMSTSKVRLSIVDALRGLALLMMCAFHFCYDLNYFGWAYFPIGIAQSWVIWQRSIASTFLLLVGIGLVLRSKFKPAWADFWRRWLQIAGAAILVSIGSYFIFPTSFIYFGILHCIAISLIVGRLLLRLGAINLGLGVGAIALANTFTNPLFNDRFLNWIGFATQLQPTEDYVPLFPWLGVVLIGCGLGKIWERFQFQLPASLVIFGDRLTWLVWIGKRSLAIYLLHQPILLAFLVSIQSFK